MPYPYITQKPDAYTPYAAGEKRYGASGALPGPNIGPADPLGYRERDASVKARNNALLRKTQAGLTKDYASPAWLSFPFARMGAQI